MYSPSSKFSFNNIVFTFILLLPISDSIKNQEKKNAKNTKIQKENTKGYTLRKLERLLKLMVNDQNNK